MNERERFERWYRGWTKRPLRDDELIRPTPLMEALWESWQAALTKGAPALVDVLPADPANGET